MNPVDGETPSPAKMQKQNAEQRHSNGGRKFCHRVEDCGRQAAFLFGKPVADGFGICGKRGRFADSQKQPRGEETANAGGNRRAKGSHGPENRADAAYAPHSKLVQQQTGRELKRRVRPIVGARQIAERDCGNSEGGVECIFRDGKIHAIEIVDEDSEAEKARDRPSASGDAVRFRNCVVQGRAA